MKKRDKPLLVRRLNFVWYPVTLVPIVGLFLAAGAGYLPGLVALFALFLFFFWLSSLGFAIYAVLKTPKEPRQ